MATDRRIHLDRHGGVTVRVGRTPTTINWTFLILVALYTLVLGRPWQYGLMFAGVALIGILLHEAGHAVAFRLVGRSSRIIIHGIGGVTISDDPGDLGDGEGAGVALAGPLVGIAVGLVALWLQLHDVGAGALWSRVLIGDWIFVNLGWGLLNLLPVIPLDGGQVLERLVGLVAPAWRHTVPFIASIVVSLACLGFAWSGGYPIGVALAGAFALLNLRWLSDNRRAVRIARADRAAEEALALASVNPNAAHGELLAALSTPLSPDVDAQVANSLAWISAWRMAPGDQAVLAGMRHRITGRFDTALLGAIDAHARGERDEAVVLLARGFAAESTPPPPWLVARLVPTTADVDALAGAIDRLGLGERHRGLSRLIATLEQAGRSNDTAGVRALMAKPVADDTFAWAESSQWSNSPSGSPLPRLAASTPNTAAATSA